MLDYDRPIQETICEAIAKTLSIDSAMLTDDTQPIIDLGAESVNYVHIVNAIEKTYNISVPFMQLRRRKTIGAMVEYIKELREQ